VPSTIAWFISPHGFGHAARSCAVIDALLQRHDDLRVVVFSTVPRWFLDSSIHHPVHTVAAKVDVGLVQRTSMEEDPEATEEALAGMPWGGTAAADDLDRRVAAVAPDLVVADIAPFGLASAARLGVPSILVENFTWDWIYRAYAVSHPGLGVIADRLQKVFDRATRRIQLTPFCVEAAGATPVPPVARPPRSDRQNTRRLLGIAPDEPVVLVSMGGIPWEYSGLERLERAAEAVVVAPGSGPTVERRGNLVTLPHRSSFYHPDLVQAADAVVGKLGYSTVAEAWASGRPFGWVLRSRFPEGPAMEAWVRREVGGTRLEHEELLSGDWLGRVPQLLSRRGSRRGPTGVSAICDVVRDHLRRP
jgi:UDP:flavonoid glycosyltransferase YjiC (YdhE family)